MARISKTWNTGEKKPDEKSVERPVCRYAKKLGFFVSKWRSENMRGVPDDIFINPNGVVAFIEFKAPGKRQNLTTLQKDIINDLKNRRTLVFVIDDTDHGKRILDVLVDARVTYYNIAKSKG